MTPLEAHMEHYRAEHRTWGCRATHMIGIPMIMASPVVVLLHWPISLVMFVAGWALLYAGHRFFERNRPVLMADPKNPLTYLSAVVFVVQEWSQLLGARRSKEPTSPTAEAVAKQRAA